MPSCRAKRSAYAAALALSAAFGSAQMPDFAQLGDIEIDPASLEFDYRTNQVILNDVRIKQGNLRLQAQRAEATSLNTDNSRWTFTGNVRVDAPPRGNLRAERAVVEFRDNRIARATITGQPAQFEQRLEDSDQLARGRAKSIEYDVASGTIRLIEDAWLTDGRTIKEIGGPLIVYNIRQERVQAASKPGTGERVRIIISPRTQKTGEDNAAQKDQPATSPTAQDPAS